MDNLPKVFNRRMPNTLFHLQWLPSGLHRKISKINPDIIHLNWICRGFVPIELLGKLKKPVVWSLHDQWPMTGGCHYDNGCRRYESCCGKCPALESNVEKDLSRWVWNRKKKSYGKLHCLWIAPSRWMQARGTNSPLLNTHPILHIPYGIDINRFRPVDKLTARNLIGLPTDKKLILFGAVDAVDDPRKGFHHLQCALQEIKQKTDPDQLELVIFGANKKDEEADIGFKSHYLGTLSDELSLVIVYAACDVFVAPSTEDNLPNTILEAMACGTPCVAFDLGGFPDMIDHKVNGYLAEPFQADALSQGILWTIDDAMRYEQLSKSAREKIVNTFDSSFIAEKFIRLYRYIMDGC